MKASTPFILVRVYRPDEGYEDVCDELILEDFKKSPEFFRVELIEVPDGNEG